MDKHRSQMPGSIFAAATAAAAAAERDVADAIDAHTTR